MTTIEVPGSPSGFPSPWATFAGMGIFCVSLLAVLAWVASDSGDPSLWALFVMFGLIVGTFVGSIATNHVGRSGRLRLTRANGCWAALGSRTGQLLILGAAVASLSISTGAILLLPAVHIGVWLFAPLSLLGIAEAAWRLKEPYGWYFDQHMAGVTVPRRGSTAFTWDEVQQVTVTRRGVDVRGRGHTVAVPGGDVASDPAVLARVVEFYRDNALQRPELSDDRFLERLRSGTL